MFFGDDENCFIIERPVDVLEFRLDAVRKENDDVNRKDITAENRV
jgi:hypothetical protein